MREIRPERELLEYAGKRGHEIYQLYFHVNAHVLSLESFTFVSLLKASVQTLSKQGLPLKKKKKKTSTCQGKDSELLEHCRANANQQPTCCWLYGVLWHHFSFVSTLSLNLALEITAKNSAPHRSGPEIQQSRQTHSAVTTPSGSFWCGR